MKTIPIVEVPQKFAAESMRLFAPETRAFVSKATEHAPQFVVKALDFVSRKYLERSKQFHQHEIAEVSRILGMPGAYFFNVNFEWSCTVRADQTKRGPEMVRVLDWGTPGLGEHVIMLKVASTFGPWYTPSWPGFAGIVHGFAPGRFAIAMNQAPLAMKTGRFVWDWILDKKEVWQSTGTLPAHLLRLVMEKADTYARACDMLEKLPISAPAIFSIVGVKDGEHKIIERARRSARPLTNTSAANHFEQLTDGHHPTGDSKQRAWMMKYLKYDFEDRDFSWLKPPILNSETVLAFVANPKAGNFMVMGIDNGKRVTETLVL